MTRRAALVGLFALSTLAACNEAGSDIEQGVTPAPRGGGFCCRIDPGSCNCFHNGGWIPNESDTCPAICDLAPVNTHITTDEHGCESLNGPESCLQPPIDAAD